MPKVVVGSIPKKVCYVYSDEKIVFTGCRWDIDYFDDTKTNKVKVLPAFPIEDGDTAIITATNWAAGYGPNKKTVFNDVVDNSPITGVKVFSSEERGAGLAYKAVIGKYYVDLREDVLMDTLLKVGVDKGGILLGDFIWAKMNSQMRLIRVGSELHKLIVEFDSKKDIKPVGKRNLEVGGVYQTRKKDLAIFIGYVNTIVFKNKNYYNKYNNNFKATFEYETRVIKKAMLFYYINNINKLKEEVDNINNINERYVYNIKKTHNFIEKIDQVELPEGIIENIRIKTVKNIKNKMLEYTGHIVSTKKIYKISDIELEDSIAYHSDHLNMYKYGGNPVEPFDVKKFLLFS